MTRYAYGPNGRLASRTKGADAPMLYAFDARGQRIRQGPQSNPASEVFGYTETGRLASWATSAGVSAAYAFDASGQRVRSVVTSASLTSTTTWTYEGLTLLSLAASRSDGATWSVTYLSDASGRAYAGLHSAEGTTTPFLIATSDRGDVVALTDSAGDPLASYAYDPWGVPTASAVATTPLIADATLAGAIATNQPLRYAGYVFDPETSMYYCSARTYDPLTRQFLSKDPAKDDGEESAYQYCGGDPAGKVDPSGAAAVKTTYLTLYETFWTAWAYQSRRYIEEALTGLDFWYFNRYARTGFQYRPSLLVLTEGSYPRHSWGWV